MKPRPLFLWMSLPVMILLMVVVIHQYGYLKVQSELADREETAAVKARTLEKYLARIAQKPRIEERLAALRERRKAAAMTLFEAPTVPLAAAALQSTVRERITARGGSIISERNERPREAGKFTIIAVVVEAILPDTRALGDTLYAIETQTPHLAIGEMDVRIRNFKSPRDLTVTLRITGLTGGR